MKIGIDISQIVHEHTGVAAYVRKLVSTLVEKDSKNEYILFGASLRRRKVFSSFVASLGRRVRLVTIPIPPTVLTVLWNQLHILPVEWFTGPVDIFWSSDWTQPPLLKARGVTTIHDLSFLRYPNESHNISQIDYVHGQLSANIVEIQKRKLMRSVRVCQMFFCDSEATKKDAQSFLHIDKKKLSVIYPGFV